MITVTINDSEAKWPALYPSPFALPPVHTETREDWVLVNRRTGEQFMPLRDRWRRLPDQQRFTLLED